MKLMGIEAIYRKRRTMIPAKGHHLYLYLLAGIEHSDKMCAVFRPNHRQAA
jgi:hypothetical protein